MASAKCVLVLSILSVFLISEASGYFWNPCKLGFYLTNPRVRRPLYCNGWTGCPWPRYYKCRSLTGSDDGFGICCYDPGEI
ncbi:hypothetical protein ACJMK2_024779 [Sinanodonta woodiana]|uniref:Uncharacterized protein n=1 Tax=Sinanodonta woodiana TaxID=1069815 RepID=A0ABD3XEF7_SINWO